MFLCRNDSCQNRVLSILFFIAIGVIAGILFPTNFLYATRIFWISLGIAAIAWVMMLITCRCCENDICREHGRNRCGLFLYILGLMAVSIVGVTVAEARTVIHAVIFGLDIALLGLVLVRSFQYFCGRIWHR